MARFLVLVLCLADLSLASVPFWWHRSRHVGPAKAQETEAEPTTERGPRLAQPTEIAPHREARPVRLARVHGVLTDGDQALDAESPISVVVRDEHGERLADVSPGGAFAIALAPGTYCFEVRYQERSSTRCGVELAAGDNKELVLALDDRPGIAGTVHLAGGEATLVYVGVEPVGDDAQEGTGESFAAGEFEVGDLQAGRHYRVEITADGFRTQILSDVVAPTTNLDVTLVRAPVVRGGFGVPRGGACPLESVHLYEPETDETTELTVDRFCRFESDPVSDGKRVRLVAKGSEGDFDLWLDIPSTGDPPFVCLRGTCRGPASDDFASLELSLVGGPQVRWEATVFVDGASNRKRGQPIVRFDDLPSREEATVIIRSDSCIARRSLILQPGVNRLSLSRPEICAGGLDS